MSLSMHISNLWSMVKLVKNSVYSLLSLCEKPPRNGVFRQRQHAIVLVNEVAFSSQFVISVLIKRRRMSATAEASTSAPKEMTFAEKQAERMKRLRSLHSARNEARTHNHQEVVAEEARNKLPPNYEAKRRQAEWLLDDQAKREEAEKTGKDYDRVKLLNISATEAERLERKKKKKNPDEGFSTYEQATIRQYNRLVKNMPTTDMEQYEKQKQKYGDAFYGGPNVIIHGMHEDRREAVDKMVDDLEGQIAKRARYSRRRTHNDDADIDYINERNAKFNKKLERFYGEHTAEIKQNLERGTAI